MVGGRSFGSAVADMDLVGMVEHEWHAPEFGTEEYQLNLGLDKKHFENVTGYRVNNCYH